VRGNVGLVQLTPDARLHDYPIHRTKIAIVVVAVLAVTVLMVCMAVTLRQRNTRSAAAAAKDADSDSEEPHYDDTMTMAMAISPIRPIPAPRPQKHGHPQARSPNVSFHEDALTGGAYLEVTSVAAAVSPPSSLDANQVPNANMVDDPQFEIPQAADDSDEAQPWYADSLRRSVCATAVETAQHGDFLIRRSKTTGAFVLVVNNNGGCSLLPLRMHRLPR
jgi:hypothetical protein